VSARGEGGEGSGILGASPLMSQVERVDIPNRSLFRQPEVCDIAHIQPYVLRSWEAEFPDLGVAKAAGGPRVYRRADLERVLRIKQLVFVEGLTLAGARRKLAEEEAVAPSADPEGLDFAELFGSDARERLLQVRRGLRELAALLAREPAVEHAPDGFRLELAPDRPKERAAKPPRKKRHDGM
jgi:DNA-binding transcriptional MerR regulator